MEPDSLFLKEVDNCYRDIKKKMEGKDWEGKSLIVLAIDEKEGELKVAYKGKKICLLHTIFRALNDNKVFEQIVEDAIIIKKKILSIGKNERNINHIN